jgi:hypothetical protein
MLQVFYLGVAKVDLGLHILQQDLTYCRRLLQLLGRRACVWEAEGMEARMKMDGMNPVSSATVYRFFPSVFVFSGMNRNGTENGTE